MKFNEKLIELRKKEGLSQEELGYKLNVTRQTVSKWELGQTIPEMEKLVEMSKIFNVSVDQLINEVEVISNVDKVIEDKIIGDQVIEEKTGRSKKVFVIIVIALIVVIILIMIKTFTAFGILFNEFTESSKNITGENKSFFGRIFNLFDKAIDSQENILENMGSVENKIENTNKEFNKTRFNSTMELYKGSNSGSSLKSLIDEVITINKTEERKVTVKYNETETQDSEEIKSLKTSFDDSKNFEIFFDYDEEGYINKATIERIISKFEVNSFNNSLEIYAGTKMGALAIHVLDDIITINKIEERKITVKYNQTETKDETEIKNIKRNIENFKDYEITFEYDAEGFINKAIIEKI